MSAAEETKSNIGVKANWQASTAGAISKGVSWFLNLLSSVRFGVSLLVLLVIAAMIGMLIMQQNVEGFDKYYAELTPSQQVLYGKLGWFDIYHVWYFNLLLLVLSLNIVLASIDRFPKAWTFVSRPKLDASANWLRGQEQNAVVKLEGESRQSMVDHVAAACRSVGLKPRVTEKGNRVFVFAQKNTWNRLGAYAVHVALLTIFTGGFLTAQFGRTGMMWLRPGGEPTSEMTETAYDLDRTRPVALQLPFEITCTDIQQKLVDKNGSINAGNTTDWLTRIKIRDESGETNALVHMNAPYDYRGYRFFQASFAPAGMARKVTLRLTPEAGGDPLEVTIPRDKSVTLPDGTALALADFWADARERDNKNTDTSDYAMPAAILTVKPPQGQPDRAFAFQAGVADDAPIAKRAVGGYTYRLLDFEKVPYMHALSIQHDPGSTTVYIGFTLLALTLIAVFFFSHQRVWALIEEKQSGSYEVTVGGNTNRNRLAFESRFKRLINAISGQTQEVEES